MCARPMSYGFVAGGVCFCMWTDGRRQQRFLFAARHCLQSISWNCLGGGDYGGDDDSGKSFRVPGGKSETSVGQKQCGGHLPNSAEPHRISPCPFVGPAYDHGCRFAAVLQCVPQHARAITSRLFFTTRPQDRHLPPALIR